MSGTRAGAANRGPDKLRGKLESLREAYRSMGIKNRTLLHVSVVVTAMVLLFAALFILVFHNRTREENVAYTLRMLENTAEHLASYFDEVDSIANEANYDYYLQNYLIAAAESGDVGNPLTKGKNMTDYNMSTKLFSSHINSRPDVSSVMVFGSNSLLLHKSIYDYWPVIMDYSSLDWYAGATRDTRRPAVTGPHHHSFLRGNTEPTISLSRTISNCNDGSFLGVMLIDLNLNEIQKICQAAYLDQQGELYILDSGGEEIYRYHMDGAASASGIIADFEGLGRAARSAERGSFAFRDGGERYQVVHTVCEKPGWQVVAVTPMSAVLRDMYSTLAMILAIIVSITALIILVLNGLLTKIVRPITALAGQMDEIEAGNLDVRANIGRRDETGRLAGSFNRMLERIQDLMIRIVAEQEDKRKFELQALQAQINPHFLYNTLDSIIWMAELRDERVVPMTEALAKLFRISLNRGNELISLRDEMEHVRNYLYIQSLRYADKFRFSVDIPANLLDYQVIKLILQPLVENSIYHGIKKKKGTGHISIQAGTADGRLSIRVADDGVGMTRRQCVEIFTRDCQTENSGGSGIGVKNVNERIKLYFGDEYGLRYESEQDRGAAAILTLPLVRRGTDRETGKERGHEA